MRIAQEQRYKSTKQEGFSFLTNAHKGNIQKPQETTQKAPARGAWKEIFNTDVSMFGALYFRLER
jgi:hypothetical protein